MHRTLDAVSPRRVPSVLRRHPLIRWGVPVVVAGAVVLVASGVFSNAAPSRSLPSTTVSELLSDMTSPPVSGFSGTVVSHVSLGLPDLPSVDGIESSSPLATLLSGSRTLQVWYGGPDRQRVALLGTTDETDLFRSGRTVWRWSSADRVADRVRLAPSTGSASPSKSHAVPDATAALGATSSALSAMTPSGLTALALRSIRPSTGVSVRAGAPVADRSTYDLVLQPRSAASKIGAVRIAVDGKTKIPLGVRVYPRGSSTAAINVSFTSVHFATPAPTMFEFTPPMGAKVRYVSAQRLRDTGALNPARISLAGDDWAGVLGYDAKRTVHTRGLGLEHAVTRVSGTWGQGRLLETSLLSVLLTRDGRIYAGAVDPAALYAAAAHK